MFAPTMRRLYLVGSGFVAVIGACLTASSAQAASFAFNGLYVSDQGLDAIYLTQDFNQNGNANDLGEINVFFDGTNASGLANPTGNVFTLLQSRQDFLYYGDGDTDSVYRLLDTNNDGDALDIGEANLWFSADNANAFPLLTPNGLAEGSDGAIYIVEADTFGSPSGDFVYRTEDLNGDGDANDAGESSIWLDLQALNPSSSPFEITFIGNVAYITDTAGGSPVIYRAEDVDGSGAIDAAEVTVLTDPFDFIFSFGLASNENDVFALNFLTDEVLRIDEGPTTTLTPVWDSTFVPDGFTFGFGFSLAAGPNGELAVTSNDFPESIFRLLDLNQDGDYFDEGETVVYASNDLTGFFPDRPRAVAYRTPIAVPEPGLALGLLVTGALGFRRWRRRSDAIG